MLVLGVETSTPQASVAIGSEQGVIASALVARGATYNEFLLPAVRFCLDQTGLGWRDLTGVAVSLITRALAGRYGSITLFGSGRRSGGAWL